ncbi:hypothetical protein K1719_005406 [Acacia pycnantha]|nr:hypothetical protein K1719_005406 [Acacia pycnantha]
MGRVVGAAKAEEEATTEETRVVEVKKSEYQCYPPSYILEMYAYPPQIFSDENPNACSVISKKIKNGDNSKYEESWPKLGTVPMKQWGPGLTFAKKLQGLNQEEDMTEINRDDEDISEDNISDSEDKNQLMSGLNLDGEDLYLEYEGLHWLCLGCGMYGHKTDDCKLRKKDPGPGTKSVGGVIKESGNTTEGEVVSMEIGQMKNNEGDTWRVVQRARRSKRLSKDMQNGDFRRTESGSRYGVLAEDGNGDDVSQTRTSPLVVQGVAVERRTQRSNSEVISWDREGETQKALRKDNGQMGEKGDLQQSRKFTRKEKRQRDSAKSGKKSTEPLLLTFGEDEGENDKYGAGSGSIDVEGIIDAEGNQKGEETRGGSGFITEVDHNPDPVWVADGIGLLAPDGPHGRFWSGPEQPDLDSNMIIEGNVVPGLSNPDPDIKMACEESEDVGFVLVVPETQGDAGI